jgi:iron(III) transport system permease protein
MNITFRPGGKEQSFRSLPPFQFNWSQIAVRTVISLIIFWFFIVPLLKLIGLSFASDSGLTLSHYRMIFQEKKMWVALINTIRLVGGSTLMAMLIGVALAFLMAFTDIRHQKTFHLLATLPLVIPSYIFTLAWTQLLSARGLAASFLTLWPGSPRPFNIYSFSGILLVMGLAHYPLVYLLTLAVLRKIPHALILAAQVSGAGRLAAFIKISLPLALSGIGGGGLLAFLAGLDNFGIPAFLGIPARIPVLSTQIYQEIVGFGPSAFSRAAVLSTILSLIALLGSLLFWLFCRRCRTVEIAAPEVEPAFRLGKWRGPVEACLGIFFAVTSFVPLAALFLTSTVRAYGLDIHWVNFTFKHYHFVLFESMKTFSALKNSLILALAVSGFCLIAGSLLAYFRVRRSPWLGTLWETAAGIPYSLPGMVFGLAMIFTWMEPWPGWNPGIYGTINMLFLAYVIRFIVLQIRSSSASFMQIDVAIEQAAASSGAGVLAKFGRILVPLILPGLLSGAFLVFTHVLTELTVSSLLSSSGGETIGMVIFNFEQAGYTVYSTAFSGVVLIWIALTALLLHFILRLSKRKEGSQWQ